MLRLRGDRFDLRAELQLRYGIEVFAHCGSNQRNDCSTGFYSPDSRSPRISGAEIADQTLHLTIVPSDHYPEVGLWKAFRWRAGGGAGLMADLKSRSPFDSDRFPTPATKTCRWGPRYSRSSLRAYFRLRSPRRPPLRTTSLRERGFAAYFSISKMGEWNLRGLKPKPPSVAAAPDTLE